MAVWGFAPEQAVEPGAGRKPSSHRSLPVVQQSAGVFGDGRAVPRREIQGWSKKHCTTITKDAVAAALTETR